MGIFKAILFIVIPTAGLTVAAFRLGNKLPLACRLFGNYIGLSYVYFKSLLAFLKPADHMPYEMISLARKTSQQSQALRRELKSTLKRVKEDISAKKKTAFEELDSQVHAKEVSEGIDSFLEEKEEEKAAQNAGGETSGNMLMFRLLKERQQLLAQKMDNRKSRKFFQEV